MTAAPAADAPRWKVVLLAVLALAAFWLLGYGAFQLAALILFSIAHRMGPAPWEWARSISGGLPLLDGIALLLGFLAATWLVSRGMGYGPDELRWRAAGSPRRGGAVAFGLGLGAAVLAMGLAVPLAHAYWLGDAGGVGAYLLRLAVLLLTLAPAAMAEEVMYRGVPTAALARIGGRPAAVLVVAVFFAAAHRHNPGVDGLSLVNIGLAGVALGAALYGPGGMWAAFGLHLGWNWSLAALDAPVSGLDLRVPLIDYFPGGPRWLSGGVFGPEGGVLGTVVLSGLVLVFVLRARRGGGQGEGTTDQGPGARDQGQGTRDQGPTTND